MKIILSYYIMTHRGPVSNLCPGSSKVIFGPNCLLSADIYTLAPSIFNTLPEIEMEKVNLRIEIRSIEKDKTNLYIYEVRY